MTAAPISPSRARALAELVSARHVAIVGIVARASSALARASAGPRRAASTLPLLLGILAIGCGIWAVSREDAPPGWGAIASGILGISFALLALQSTLRHLSAVFSWGTLLGATLLYATPLTYGALGGLMSERSGVVNIALEGMMLMGAFFGIWGSVTTGSWVLGLLIAMGVGGLTAFVYGVFAIHFRADQIVGGTAVNFLAVGITGYLFIQIYGSSGTPDLSNAESIPDVHLHFLGNGFFGQVLGQLNLMIWLVFALMFVLYSLVFKTSVGLRIRAVGEHPRAADTVGIDVYLTRYVCVTVSGMLAAMGGAYLSIGFVHSFNENMTGGPRVHRPRGADLREVEAVRRLRRRVPVRVLDRARVQRPVGICRLDLVAPALRRAVPDAPVHPHPRRGRRRHRPFGAARSRRPPL